MTTEALDPIPLSALQHRAYCPRRRALIHVEPVFEDNLLPGASCLMKVVTSASACAPNVGQLKITKFLAVLRWSS